MVNASLVRLTAALFTVLLTFSIVSCGGGGGSGGDGADAGDSGNPAVIPLTALPGDAAALASSVITDFDADINLDPAEFSTNLDGNDVQRTELKIVFFPTATVEEVNALLTEFSADIVASLEGYPALVVRVPDPGSLQALETLAADINSRGIVAYVLQSLVLEPLVLPGSLTQSMSPGIDPTPSQPFSVINAQNFAIRAPAAWNLDLLKTQRPPVIVVDFFGSGSASSRHFDLATIPGFINGQGMLTNPANADSHGYDVLSVIAGRHSGTSRTTIEDAVTGVVPAGVGVSVVDMTSTAAFTNHRMFMRMLHRVKKARDNFNGTIVVNLSIGFKFCAGGQTYGQVCYPYAAINDGVVDFIKSIRHANVESRALIVGAAGNKTSNTSPADSETGSFWGAAGTADLTWTDPVDNTTVLPLTNVLMVENARREAAFPFAPVCVDDNSFYGGQIAAVGTDVAVLDHAGVLGINAGTSFAAPQVAGIAAYIASIRSDLSPQAIIEILDRTAVPLVDTPTTNCEPTSDAPMLDAYAALLATDPLNDLSPQSALGRLVLLDITDAQGRDFSPDGSFNIHDLQKWTGTLTNNFLMEQEKYYSRYDLNGDGIAGAATGARFDLDLSIGPGTTRQYTDVTSQLFGDEVSYDENSVNDFEIVCYYANSPLYEVTAGQPPSTVEDRDQALEAIADFCDPCLAFATASTLGATDTLQVRASAAEQCEGIVLTIDPGAVALAPGETQQFTATVTGANDTSVTWTATGGIIDPNGLFTAGNTAGSFTVTATSNEDSAVSDSATVTIEEDTDPPADSISGFYPGSGLYTEADAICDPPFEEELALMIQQQGNQVVVDYYDSVDASFLDTRFSGTYENGVLTAVSEPSGEFGCGPDDRPCTIDATATLGNDGLVTISGRMLLGRVSGTCSGELFEGRDSFEFTLNESPD